MEKILIIIGASIFGILGTMHLLYTFFTNKFTARNQHVVEAMQSTSPVLTKETTMWKAWIGFNASHSLGAIAFSGVYLLLSIEQMEMFLETKGLLVLAVLVGVSYVVLAKQYWFRIPFVGLLIATLCFLGAAILVYT